MHAKKEFNEKAEITWKRSSHQAMKSFLSEFEEIIQVPQKMDLNK
jgi:hypothetical protein